MSKKQRWHGTRVLNAYDLICQQPSVTAQVSYRGAPTWVPARSLGLDTFTHRLKAAWLVWTCRADALIWPGQGDQS